MVRTARPQTKDRIDSRATIPHTRRKRLHEEYASKRVGNLGWRLQVETTGCLPLGKVAFLIFSVYGQKFEGGKHCMIGLPKPSVNGWIRGSDKLNPAHNLGRAGFTFKYYVCAGNPAARAESIMNPVPLYSIHFVLSFCHSSSNQRRDLKVC